MKKLESLEGYKYYDGNTIATEVCLPDDADESVWKTITNAEADEIMKEKMAEIDADHEKMAEDMISPDLDEHEDYMSDSSADIN